MLQSILTDYICSTLIPDSMIINNKLHKMYKIFSSRVLIILLIINVLFDGSVVYSQQKSDASSQTRTVQLKYNFPSDRAIKYLNINKVIQDMDVNGQSMVVYVDTYLGCQVRLSGMENENLRLEIRIDTLAQHIDSPQGLAGGTVKEARDKVFSVVVTPSGNLIDLSEAAKIAYLIPGSGETDAAQTFMGYFPILPADPVKKGDTWILHDTISSISQSSSMWMPAESTCKLEGFEEINGFDCAKISSVVSGTWKMTNYTQGMDISTQGPLTSTRTLFFAIKEGFFIKESITTRVTGKTEIANQNMVFPVVMDISSTNEIVK